MQQNLGRKEEICKRKIMVNIFNQRMESSVMPFHLSFSIFDIFGVPAKAILSGFFFFFFNILDSNHMGTHHQSEESQGHRLWLLPKTTTTSPSQVSVHYKKMVLRLRFQNTAIGQKNATIGQIGLQPRFFRPCFLKQPKTCDYRTDRSMTILFKRGPRLGLITPF